VTPRLHILTPEKLVRLKRRWWWWLVPLVVLGVISCPTHTGGQAVPEPHDPTPHSEALLAVESDAVAPGSTLSVGLVLTLDPGWHTYWKNPGDSGSEAILEWTLPEGFTAGPVQWPRPERVPYPPLMSYGYHDRVMLLTDVAVPEGLEPGSTAHVELRAWWLVCQETCLPAEAAFATDLPVVSAPPGPDPAWAELFETTRALLPLEAADWKAVALETPAGYKLELTPPAGWAADPEHLYFFAADPTAIDHVEPQSPIRAEGILSFRLVRSAYNTGPTELDGVLVRDDGGGFDGAETRPALAVTAPVRVASAQEAGPTGTGDRASLWMALALALAGGVLLNLMPCVFPVLSLKIMGFVHHAAGDVRRTRRHGLAFAGGVVLSFLALATLLMAVRAAGAQVGWGFQLQSPPVVALLALLLFAIGLMLAGVVEPGLFLTRLGGVGAGDSGYRGSFLTGVLAVVVATPCTAPFMGAAIGVALVRPPVQGLLVFAALGVGMATPYAVLSFWPVLLERMPRPGPWMETLKQALAFPMFAVVVWLVWVFGLQTGVGGAAALLASLTFVALGTWVLGRWPAAVARGRARLVTRAIAGAAFLLAVGTAYRGSRAEPPAPTRTETTWEPFGDGSTILAHRRSGRPVFVDFTAAWCISCQVNERVVLATPRVVGAFRERDVALVKADWTRRDPEITRALASFGRSGVPLYVLYPPDPTGEPELLPAVLTQGLVLEALDRVVGPVLAGRPENR